jgi:hypothetical protein
LDTSERWDGWAQPADDPFPDRDLGRRSLDDAVRFLRRFVVLSDEQAVAVALWVAHTHAFDAAYATGYLAVTSAEKQSGKTRLLEVLELLVAKPWFTGRTSAAALTRKIADQRPTLLLDESDAAFNGDKDYAEALRGILNSGHRRGGVSSLCVGVGANIEVRDFTVFSPKAIAGIGRLPDTVADRSIAIRLKRRAPGEHAERFRHRDAEPAASPIRDGLADWADTHGEALASATPTPPRELSDRACDGWEPLLAIADLVGGDWPERARAAAVALANGAASQDESDGVQLLADIQAMFDERGIDRFPSADLAARLVAVEGAAWADWGHGKGLTANTLARLLRAFEIRPRTIKLHDGSTPKGYHRHQFEEAFGRYLAACTPCQTATPPQPASLCEKKAISDRNPTPLVAVSKQVANPHEETTVAEVAVQHTKHGRGGEKQPVVVGDEAYLELLDRAHAAGHVTDRERRKRRRVHFVIRGTGHTA